MRTAQLLTRRPTWRWKNLFGVLGVVLLPFAVIHLFTRTAVAWLGRDVFLGIAILLLVIFILVAFAALIYGFGQENPLRRSSRVRRGSVKFFLTLVAR